MTPGSAPGTDYLLAVALLEAVTNNRPAPGCEERSGTADLGVVPDPDADGHAQSAHLPWVGSNRASAFLLRWCSYRSS
ncbi:MAG TPA: hypothetical protein VE462_06750 [Propionibacteriaceae bacterium]|nr:hypothetical protein [Propionibacteriaceae bacterium]